MVAVGNAVNSTLRAACLLAPVAIFVLVATASFGDTVTLRNGSPNPFGSGVYSGAEDTGILWQTVPWWDEQGYHSVTMHYFDNYGSSQTICLASYDSTGDLTNGMGLIRFDVSGLAGRSIQSARLTLYIEDLADPWENTYSAVKVSPMHSEDGDWVAGSSDAQPETGASCFSYKGYNTKTWARPTDHYVGWNWGHTDWTLSTDTGLTVPTDGMWFYKQVSVDISPSLISSWAASPASNPGLLIGGADNIALGGTFNNFCSSESTDLAMRPALEVTFVPEPSPAVVLAALASLAGLLRLKTR
jgi:hypothetical protein